MSYPNLQIRPARESDLPSYTDLLQKLYAKFYSNEAIGLTPDCFSKEIFATNDTQKYLRSNLETNNKQEAWVAYINGQIIGSITATQKDSDVEIKGFYVAESYQGKGIGKKLWSKARDFAKGHELILDLYAHNKQTLEMYRKWGFKIDQSRGDKGHFTRHWPEWPDGVNPDCVYLRLANTNRKV